MAAAPTGLTIRAPDDFHVHLRDGPVLAAVAPLTAATFARALVMPNLQPPVRTLADAEAYRSRILAALPSGTPFKPLMTLYLTDTTTPEDIRAAAASGFVPAAKLYPAGATTNSALGVTSLDAIADVLSAMQDSGMVLCVHGEVTRDSATGADVDVFDRETKFVRDVLPGLLATFPTLRVVLEHATTADAVAIVQATPGNRLAATLTAHHLLYSRAALFAGAKIHPHMFCLPVLKRERHRRALLAAAAGDDRGLFFAGTDSAPHVRGAKLCASGCAGIFTAGDAVALYAEAFEEAGAMAKLEAFMSENGARFYGVPLNEGTVALARTVDGGGARAVADAIPVGDGGEDAVIPLRAGETLPWTVSPSLG
jgi:dihydroorotase